MMARAQIRALQFTAVVERQRQRATCRRPSLAVVSLDDRAAWRDKAGLQQSIGPTPFAAGLAGGRASTKSNGEDPGVSSTQAHQIHQGRSFENTSGVLRQHKPAPA